MSTTSITEFVIEQFITRGKASGASERANYQLFLTELCDLLQIEKPNPASAKVKEASYTFERPVEFNDDEGKITTNFIDPIKRIALFWKQNKVLIKQLLVFVLNIKTRMAYNKQELQLKKRKPFQLQHQQNYLNGLKPYLSKRKPYNVFCSNSNTRYLPAT